MQKTLLIAILSMAAIVSSTLSAFDYIEYSDDLKKFLGCVVAYKTSSRYLAPEQSYRLNVCSDEFVKYGYVDQEMIRFVYGEAAFGGLTRLVNSNGIPSTCALSNLEVKDAALRMRKVTPEEITAIEYAVRTGWAKFEYRDDNVSFLAKIFPSDVSR